MRIVRECVLGQIEFQANERFRFDSCEISTVSGDSIALSGLHDYELKAIQRAVKYNETVIISVELPDAAARVSRAKTLAKQGREGEALKEALSVLDELTGAK